jgi:2-amino-4-hydroxy-6-hydroxymethyldihydropteridine diphosphokinase
MARAFLGLGTNLGDRHANLAAAVTALAAAGNVTRTSRRYETAPVGFLSQPRFLNQVVELDTALPPLELFHAVKHIETAMGRTGAFRNGPRLIDIDILLYDDVVLSTPELTIPHPRLTHRAFVLRPLAELVDHVQDTPMVELLKRVHDQDAVAVAHQ